MFRPGELDECIDFYKEVRYEDGMGGAEVDLELIEDEVSCKVRPLSGKEADRYDKVNSEEITLFVTRYRTDIVEENRIVWDGESYNIRHIPRTSKRSMYSEFYAERGVAQ